MELLPKIADYFGVSIDYLFGRGQIKADSGFTQKDFLERLDSMQRELSENSFLYNDTIKSLVALEFENDEAKRDAIDSISSTFRSRDGLRLELLQNYQRMYEQIAISERTKK